MFLNEQPLSIVIYPTSKLILNHPQIDQIASFVNNAYYERTKERIRGDRVLDAEDLVAQMGETALTVLITSAPSQKGEEPIFCGLGAARLFQEPKDITVWSPRIPPDKKDEFERWELKVVCSNPTIDRQGMGALVMDLLELAIKRRHKALGSSRRLQIVLSAVREVVGGFYKKRGFETCHEVYIAPGARWGRLATESNPQEFHVDSMTKVL